MTGADTMIADVRQACERLLSPGSGVLLAVSGGSDSMGLMHLIHRFAPELRLELAVGFVNHGLREGIDEEWELVSARARDLGLTVERIDIAAEEVAEAGSRGSLQQWAREVRYRDLTSLAERLGLGCVATGHTREDQAETVLLRLIRGTGIDGLGGIPPRRDLSERVAVVRPLLGVGRADIRRFLEDQGVGWVDDPSNEDERYLRAQVRLGLIPTMDFLQPGISSRLAALADEARGASHFLEQYISSEKFYDNLRLNGGVKVDHEVFEGLPPSIWSRLVRTALRQVRGDLRRIERSHLHPIEDLVRGADSGGPLPLPGEVEVHVYRGTLFVFPEPLPDRPTGSGQPVAAGHGLWSARFAALGAIAEIRGARRDLVEDLEVRARRPGDRLEGSERKLKELMSERRVPRPYRDFVPVLAAGDKIVASPSLLRCRREGIDVRWVLDDEAPFLDFDFPRTN